MYYKCMGNMMYRWHRTTYVDAIGITHEQFLSLIAGKKPDHIWMNGKNRAWYFEWGYCQEIPLNDQFEHEIYGFVPSSFSCVKKLERMRKLGFPL